MINKVFPILAVSIFSALLGFGIVTPLLPLYAQVMGATGIQIGILVSGYGICNTFLSPVMGGLSDRIGRKALLCTGLLAYSILSLGYVWAANILQLILVRLLQGAAASMIIPIAMAYVGDVSPKGEEGKWMGYTSSAFFSGFGIGPLLGGTLGERFGINVAFYSMGGLCLLAFMIATAFLPEIRQRKMGARTRLAFKEMSASHTVRGLFSFRLTQSFGRGSLMTFLPIFAATYVDLSPSLIGILLAVNMLLMTMFSAPLGRIADIFNRKAMIILGNLMFLISLASIPLMHDFWSLLWLCLPLGIGAAIAMTASQALTVEEGRDFGMGSTMAIVTMAMGMGMATGPILSGVIADLVNISSAFYFGAAIVFIGTILFAWFTKSSGSK